MFTAISTIASWWLINKHLMYYTNVSRFYQLSARFILEKPTVLA